MLLSVLGGTVKLGVCPCEGGVFMGDCACDLQASLNDACDSCKAKHHTPPETKHHTPEKDDKPKCTQGPCDNLTIKSTEAFVFDPPVKAPDDSQFSQPPVIPFDAFDDVVLLLASGQILETNKLRPPPDLFKDTRFSYTGFMRPELA